jgi:hypothetical protein
VLYAVATGKPVPDLTLRPADARTGQAGGGHRVTVCGPGARQAKNRAAPRNWRATGEFRPRAAARRARCGRHVHPWRSTDHRRFAG